MGTDNLFYKGVEKRAIRKVEIRNKRATTWLIVCEGTVTEKNYFEDLVKYINQHGKYEIKVKVMGTGENTKGVVRRVEDFFTEIDKELRKGICTL